MLSQAQRHPHGPSDVQRRQRGVLVAQRLHAPRRTCRLTPPSGAAERGHDVREAVIEQARWSCWKQPVADQADGRGNEQRVASLAIALVAPERDPYQDRGRDEVVQRGVEVGEQETERRHGRNEIVERPLDVQVGECLEVEDLLPAFESRAGVDAHRSARSEIAGVQQRQ